MTVKDLFFVAVSTKENLSLCIRHGLAGFPSTENGAWAFEDIRIGDFVSFLYGAHAHNLYRVVAKDAVLPESGDILPPWPPLFFKESRRTVDFPFRLKLEPIRDFVESIARTEFAYLSESLLSRGGYWKSHFQADQTTLSSVTSMGAPSSSPPESLGLPPHRSFEPRFAKVRRGSPPRLFRLREVVIQALLRQKLKEPPIQGRLLEGFLDGPVAEPPLEVLGEKGIPEGIIDILLKNPHPAGQMIQFVVEVKTTRPGRGEGGQLGRYMDVLGRDCKGGIMLAPEFPSSRTPRVPRVRYARYNFDEISLNEPRSFEELGRALRIEMEGRLDGEWQHAPPHQS
jgi:hypothetical protein